MNTKQLLIIDDEPDILEFLSYNFAKQNFTVNTAENGLEGLKKAEQLKPDLIISDILMPKMTGVDMCSKLKKEEHLKNIPLLFLTAVNDDYKVLHAMLSGADQFASKPIKFKYLLSIVNTMLGDEEPVHLFI